MLANRKVNVAWQIVFTFIPIVNFWAFYRIKALQRYLLYVFVPSIALSIVNQAVYEYLTQYLASSTRQLEVGFCYWGSVEGAFNCLLPTSAALITINAIRLAFQGFAIYLIIIWSRKHNRQFDQPMTQTQT